MTRFESRRGAQGRAVGRKAGLVASILLVASAVGCLGRSPVVDHYVLGAQWGRSPSPAEASTDLSVLVGPVRLPAYLDRSQMASLRADGEVELDEFRRWLGGFEENFLRSVSLGLAHELGSIRVVSHPSKAPFPIDYRVRLHVDDFVLLSDRRELRTRIRWALMRPESDSGSELFVMEETRPVPEATAAGLVAAYDAALTELVTRIARRITEIETSR